MNPMDMLAGFNQKMEEMKHRAATTEVTGEAGGGLVTVSVTCDYNCTGVHIDPKAAEDPEMLEDLIRAATNEALRQAKETTANAMGELAAGLPIPPGMLGM